MSRRVTVGVGAALLLCSGCSMLDSPSAMWHGWVQRSREDAAKAVKDIKADWDLHDGEGVEAFGGGATEQLREMRGEMDRSATMSTY